MIEKEYTNSKIIEIIDEHIHSLRNRNILKARYVDGMTYEAIAEKFEISARHAKKIVYDNELKILKFL